MDSQSQSQITQILQRFPVGGEAAFKQLFDALYPELRAMAQRCFRRESGGVTIQPTALVHEAYLRLVDQERVDWKGRSHFLGVAAQAMRRILVDQARRRGADKRGGQWTRIELDERRLPGFGAEEDIEAVDSALTKLAELDPQQARLVELRFFSGLSVAEAADVLGMSQRSAEREWTMVRAWLRRELARRETT